jgi:SAM-dependent methyltransferase
VSSRRKLEELAAELIDSGSREHYSDAALYDYEYRRRRADVTFYRQLAKQRLGSAKGARILELGCGSGRVTIPLARDGHTVVAIDQMPPMLAKLRQRIAKVPASVATRITPLAGELCTFKAPGTFPLVIAAFNVLEHLYTRGELAACLSRVADHLAPGGAFAFDVQLPDLEWLARDPTKRWAKTKFTDPSTGNPMLYSTNHDYDAINQIAVIRLYYEPVDGKGPSKIVKLTQRKWFPAELEAAIAHAGFRLTARYGDFFWGELTGTAESQVLVVERTSIQPSGRRKPPRKG